MLHGNVGRLSILTAVLTGPVPFACGQIFTTIDVPGASSTQAYGINNSGQIVGSYGANGFWDVGGAFTPIVPGDNYSYAYGISATGTIVGTYRPGPPGTHVYGFLYSNGVVTAQISVSATSTRPKPTVSAAVANMSWASMSSADPAPSAITDSCATAVPSLPLTPQADQ